MKALIIGGLLFATAASASASAQPRTTAADPDAFRARVRYADLDLGRRAGAEALLTRLRIAAKYVCNQRVPTPESMRTIKRRRACIQGAMVAAVEGVNAPLVTALYLDTYPNALASR